MWGSKRTKTLGSGDQAPEVHLKTLAGEPWSLQEGLKEHPVLLVFFKIACPTCQFSLPFVQRMAQSTAVRIVLVSQDDAEGTRQFQEHFRITLPTVLDEPRSFPASNAFGITHVPSFFLVGRNGAISAAFDGFVRAELLELGQTLGIAPFRAGEPVPAMRPG